MTDQEIKDRLKKEIEAETPDLWKTLREECSFSEEKTNEPALSEREGEDDSAGKVVSIEKRPRRWRHLYTSLATAAAVLAIVAAVQTLSGRSADVNSARTEAVTEESLEGRTAAVSEAPLPEETGAVVKPEIRQAAAIVGIDVNPSVEMEIDAENRVIGFTAVNSDADAILAGMDLTGSDVTVAAYALVGSMLTHGYLTDSANSILVSVTSDEYDKGRMLEELLSEELNGFLENSQINAAIIGQYLKTDTGTQKFAEEHGISIGKARIIKSLAAEREYLTEESLLSLSTQELLLLWTRAEESKTAGSETKEEPAVTVYGTVSTNEYISADEAVSIALQAAGAGEAETQMIDTDYDCYNGTIVYEVDFIFGNVEYEVCVHATTGEVLSVESEAADPEDVFGETDMDDDDDYDDDIDDADDYDDDIDDADDYDDDMDDTDDYDTDDDDDGPEEEYHDDDSDDGDDHRDADDYDDDNEDSDDDDDD